MNLSLRLSLVFGLSACVGSAPSNGEPLAYPESARESVRDDFFGTTVADPYRWLEDDGDRTDRWVAQQNAVSEPFLSGLPAHDEIAQRVETLWNYERFGAPVVRAGSVIWSHNTGLQNQSVWWIAPLETAPEGKRVLLDPNTFSDDGTVALNDWQMSRDGSLLAYAISDGGSDWVSWRVLEVATGKLRDDVVRHTKFHSVSWARDGQSFYYNRYPVGADGLADEHKKPSVYQHRIGTAQSEDPLVYQIEDHARRFPNAEVSTDGRFLVFDIFDGYDVNAIHYSDLSQANAPVVRLLDAWDARYTFLGNHGSELFFLTTRDAPRGRVVAIDVEGPTPSAWREVVPQSDDNLSSASYVGGRMVAVHLADACSKVSSYHLDGRLDRELALPGLCTATGLSGEHDNPTVYCHTTGFTNPGIIHRWNLQTGATDVFQETTVRFDPNRFETKQHFVAHDGVRVPVFVVQKKGQSTDMPRPTLLYGYGGFNSPETPRFGVATIAWLEMGGIYAVACLRGGGEYGKAWHEAGTKLQKQNVFDDFLAVSEWLIAEGYTSSDRLAIQGGSNGGLLVGACVTQRPELFGAVLPAVGVLDMLRYHLQGANARQWSSDLGLAENEEEFGALHAYSPYHAVKEGTDYPPMLITTALGDNRVAPWHSFKFAAALQHAQRGAAPILLKVGARAGHGAGKPTSMRIKEVADRLAFLSWALARGR
ncbi:MAG: prolyl oligopeptidase [Planctomycetota bacterium]|jgi:prolyl oligopeptidase